MDFVRKYQRGKYHENKEKMIQKNREWRNRNPEKSKLSSVKWRKKNPQKTISQSSIRRGRQRNAISEIDTQSAGIIKSLYLARKRISECCGILFHVDHVIPISRGGLHIPQNLQIIPAKTNLQKSNKIIDSPAKFLHVALA
jgi:5-methylcytosine-specific restriction endonuclease McrA